MLLTQDVTTITHYAYQRVAAGLRMPGVFEINRTTPISELLDDLLLLIACSHEAEWEGQVRYLPLR